MFLALHQQCRGKFQGCKRISDIGQLFGSMHSRDFFSLPYFQSGQSEGQTAFCLSLIMSRQNLCPISSATKVVNLVALRGNGVARLVEIQRPEVQTPSEAQEKFVRVFLSQKCCADSLSVCPTPVCIRTHKNEHIRTLKIL